MKNTCKSDSLYLAVRAVPDNINELENNTDLDSYD